MFTLGLFLSETGKNSRNIFKKMKSILGFGLDSLDYALYNGVEIQRAGSNV